MQNFARFHAIDSRQNYLKNFEKKKKRYSSFSYKAICIQIASRLFLMIYILRIVFCGVSSTRNPDQRITKISEKVKLQRHLLSDFLQTLIDVKLSLNNTKYKISLNSLD